MNPQPSSPPATSGSDHARCDGLRGGGILIGGTLVTALVSPFVTVPRDGLDSRMLPFLVVIVIWVVLFFSVKAATHPIRGRSDERPSWKERFPSHTDEEIQRFLQVAGGSLGVSEKHLARLRPDDHVAALTQEWLCGDGMDVVELLMAIENEYALDLPMSFHEKDRTLGDLFDYVSGGSTKRPNPSADNRSDQSKRDPSRNLDGGHGNQTAVQ